MRFVWAAVVAGALTVLPASPASAVDGGITVDRDVITINNVYPGNPGYGHVALTNTSRIPLYISAITAKTGSMSNVNLSFEACSQQWSRSNTCGGSQVSVMDYELAQLETTNIKSLNYVIQPGYVTFFQVKVTAGESFTGGTGRQEASLTFDWVAQVDPPPASQGPVQGMPGTFVEGVMVPEPDRLPRDGDPEDGGGEKAGDPPGQRPAEPDDPVVPGVKELPITGMSLGAAVVAGVLVFAGGIVLYAQRRARRR